MTDVHPAFDLPETTSVGSSSDENLPCKKCALPISEGHAYDIGGDRWHIECFTCSKCLKLLGCQSDFLVLGTGDLVCSSCSYSCHSCGKKIDDLAILTGNQAYCLSCFKCRSCKKRIEDLRYARTSKGLFCMACHEKLIARKKKYDSRKEIMEHANAQNRLKQQERERPRRRPPSDETESSARESLAPHDGPITPRDSPLSRSDSLPTQRDVLLSESLTSLRDGQHQFSGSHSVVVSLHESVEDTSHSPAMGPVASSSPEVSAPASTEISAAPVSSEASETSLDLPKRSPNRKFVALVAPVVAPLAAKPTFLAPPVEIATTPVASSHSDDSASPVTPGEPFFLLPAPKGARATPQPVLSPNRPPPSPMAHINRRAHIISNDDAITLDYKGDHEASSLYNFVANYSPQDEPRPISGLGLSHFGESPVQIVGKEDYESIFPAPVHARQISITDTLSDEEKPYRFGGANGLGAGPAPSLAPAAIVAAGPVASPAHRKKSSLSSLSSLTDEPLGRKLSRTILSPPRNLFRLASAHRRTGSATGSFAPLLPEMRDEPRATIDLARATPVSPSFSSNRTPPVQNSPSHGRSTSDSVGALGEHVRAELELRAMKSDNFNLMTQRSSLRDEITRLVSDKEVLLTEVCELRLESEGLQIMVSELNLQVEILREVSEAKRRELEDISKQTLRPKPKSAKVSPVLEAAKFGASVKKSLSHDGELEPVAEHDAVVDAAEVVPRAKARFWRKPRLGGDDVGDSPSPSDGRKGFSLLAKSKSYNVLDQHLAPEIPLFGGIIAERAAFERRALPFIVTKCTEVVEQFGLDHVGIYRVSGGSSQVDKLEKYFLEMPAGGDARRMLVLEHALTAEDINAVPSVLKRYLRKLRDPLMTFAFYDRFIALGKGLPAGVNLLSCDSSPDIHLKKVRECREIVGKLPETNRVCLEVLTRHLHVVAARADENKMHMKNLSMVFAPTLTWDRTGEREMEDMGWRNESTEFMIKNYKDIFAKEVSS
ncbi:hypothetical protein BABINDRAFT_163947 [Babjeviella inositovora NRRL Y-12698]|uniref:RhoGAP-domain-containing protein n=1 Tax=Babjeviella inositovora NRRL Y-12698 TaxID=984486 RepID=A0A1E3QGX3_9ASCO|nr:uncharacterized protein BABINDRAFT_163947 [Babjeviella inositovora NRRL Y-12698]ODQ76945.1 hypothetical protein BABINDRAFT_163947 [Babjeviella inositovora NRRL Y-12698]